MSRIITFYSYKGGVGRTLALANIGVLLAKLGKRVLLMDWDLEAPGLDRYFQPYFSEGLSSTKGIVHLLHESIDNSDSDWRSHVHAVTVKPENVSRETSYTLSIIPSGVASSDYGLKVRTFSWTAFMEKHGGPTLERWRDEWKKDFDFVLIDSRTGITDTGGICTVLLPDLLVLVFAANDQSFEGGLRIAESAQLERRNLAVQRPRLTIRLRLIFSWIGSRKPSTTQIAEEWSHGRGVKMKLRATFSFSPSCCCLRSWVVQRADTVGAPQKKTSYSADKKYCLEVVPRYANAKSREGQVVIASGLSADGPRKTYRRSNDRRGARIENRRGQLRPNT